MEGSLIKIVTFGTKCFVRCLFKACLLFEMSAIRRFHYCISFSIRDVQNLYKGFAQRLKTNLILYLNQVIMLPIKQYPPKNGRCVTFLQQMEMIDKQGIWLSLRSGKNLLKKQSARGVEKSTGKHLCQSLFLKLSCRPQPATYLVTPDYFAWYAFCKISAKFFSRISLLILLLIQVESLSLIKMVSFGTKILIIFKSLLHCVKSVCIRSYSGSHFPAFGLNIPYLSVFSPNAGDQNNSEYGHFSGSVSK